MPKIVTSICDTWWGCIALEVTAIAVALLVGPNLFN